MEESIGKSKKLKTDKKEFIMSTVSAFMKANIPIEKFDFYFHIFSNFKNHFKNT